MLEKLVENTILRNRPEHTHITTYGSYEGIIEQEATYSDDLKHYDIREHNNQIYGVKSAKAFVAYIMEELKRRKNTTGKYATAKITLQGGEFTADCNFNKGICNYTRLNSEQYKILEHFKDQVLDHEEFLTMLQKLKPSIVNFAELYARCSKIRVVGRSQMNSQPIFDDEGNAESSFICTYKLEDGTDEDVSLPASFTCTIPFAKAGELTYEYTVELLFFNTSSNRIAIKVQVPDWETNEEQAIIDEANSVKAELSELKELLVLADF